MRYLIHSLSFISQLKSKFNRYKIRHLKVLIGVAILFTLTYKITVDLLTEEIPIFGFHNIINLSNFDENNFHQYQFNSDYGDQNLEVFIESLVRKDYWFLTSQELYNYFLKSPHQRIPSEHQGQKKVMLTFDDGYKSLHTSVLPILQRIERKYHRTVKVVVFINPGFLNHKGTVLDKINCQELRAGFRQNFYDIQSHGLNHEDLIKISPKALQRELSEAQIRLKKCTEDLDREHTVALHLAYPFGDINNPVIQEVTQYYLSGYLYNSKILKIGLRYPNPYRIPRLTVNKHKSVQDLLKLATGGWL